MSKYVYIIEPTDKSWLSTKSVEDDYKLSENETFVKPADGLNTPIVFDGTNWNGAAKPEVKQLTGVGMTAEKKMLMAQATQISEMQKMIMAQASAIAAKQKGDA